MLRHGPIDYFFCDENHAALWERYRLWGRAPASKVGAAGGGDVKAPDQEEELIEDAEVASAVLQCPGQVAGGASKAPAPSKGPARPIAASRPA